MQIQKLIFQILKTFRSKILSLLRKSNLWSAQLSKRTISEMTSRPRSSLRVLQAAMILLRKTSFCFKKHLKNKRRRRAKSPFWITPIIILAQVIMNPIETLQWELVQVQELLPLLLRKWVRDLTQIMSRVEVSPISFLVMAILLKE